MTVVLPLEGTPVVRRRWHNPKYFMCVEHQGKTVAELRALEAPQQSPSAERQD